MTSTGSAGPDALPPDDGATPRRRRWPIWVVTLLVVVVILAVIADHVGLNYYAIQPGQAQAVGPLIRVPPEKGHRISGSVLLTDVYLAPVTLLNVVPYLLSSDTDLVSSSQVLGPYTPAAELTAQGYLEMAQSQSAAKSLALRSLGYQVGESNAGAIVFSVEPGTPAYGALQVGQIVKAVDGQSTPTSCAFVSAVHGLPAGSAVTLTVEQSTVTPEAEVKPGPTVQRTVHLGRPRGSVPSGCPGVSGPERGFLGVSANTQQDFTYPFPVEVDTTDIGGPSAGLAMTLGIIDKLSTGDVTGRQRVAATGTIDASGQVGDVSGVPQKTVAVEQAGASVFLVPPPELGAARSKATPSLHVYAVSSLSQALSVLRHLGGAVPRGR